MSRDRSPPRVGILGGGQLGLMLGLAARPLGIEPLFLDPSPASPARAVGELIVGEWDDLAALDRLASAGVVTYEFENVPAATADHLARSARVLPPPRALAVAQDRLAEKTRFRALGIPTPEFRAVDDAASLRRAVDELSLPCVLKTRRLGYDGKGQSVLRTPADVDAACAAADGTPSIAEAWVPFERELSVLAVRGASGEHAFYPLVENEHQRGVLRTSRVPARVSRDDAERSAHDYAERLLDDLDYTGVLALELFDTGSGLLANEIAPRVHNSGHWTIEGAETSQFEQHLRAVLGWPLGSTALVAPCAMLNALGSLPERERVLAVPGAHLHDYGKAPRRGRKVGHVTVRARDAAELERRIDELSPLVPFEL